MVSLLACGAAAAWASALSSTFLEKYLWGSTFQGQAKVYTGWQGNCLPL